MKRLTEGRGVDVIVTACPVGQAQKDAVALAAKRGRISLFGGLAKETSGFLDSNAFTTRSCQSTASTPRRPGRTRTSWRGSPPGKLDVRKYITRMYPLEEIESAFKDLQSQSVFKAVVKPA